MQQPQIQQQQHLQQQQQQQQIQQQQQQHQYQQQQYHNSISQPIQPIYVRQMPPLTQLNHHNSSAYAAATLRRQPNLVRDSIETIPSSNAIDSAMYERDKQIYKCSTMRPGGKYDDKSSFSTKPSILNCPLPEIPKQNTDSQDSIKLDSVPPLMTR